MAAAMTSWSTTAISARAREARSKQPLVRIAFTVRMVWRDIALRARARPGVGGADDEAEEEVVEEAPAGVGTGVAVLTLMLPNARPSRFDEDDDGCVENDDALIDPPVESALAPSETGVSSLSEMRRDDETSAAPTLPEPELLLLVLSLPSFLLPAAAANPAARREEERVDRFDDEEKEVCGLPPAAETAAAAEDATEGVTLERLLGPRGLRRPISRESSREGCRDTARKSST